MVIAKLYRYSDLSGSLIDYLKETRFYIDEVVMFNEKFIMEKIHPFYRSSLNYEMERILSHLNMNSLLLSEKNENTKECLVNNCMNYSLETTYGTIVRFFVSKIFGF